MKELITCDHTRLCPPAPAACRARGWKAGLCNVLVTNGHINTKPLEALLPLIDAMNIDLKGFT